MRSFFGVFLRNKPHFVRIVCTFISSRGTIPRLKIVIPDGRAASGIVAYGKWIANAGALCRCSSCRCVTCKQILRTPISRTGVWRFSRGRSAPLGGRHLRREQFCLFRLQRGAAAAGQNPRFLNGDWTGNTSLVMARRDRATQPARVCALIESFIAWMARCCGP